MHTNNAFVSVVVETDDAFICVIVVHTDDAFVSVIVHMLSLQNDIILILCSFHLIMHFEECTPGVTVNYEFIFWDLHRTFPILAGLCLQGLV